MLIDLSVPLGPKTPIYPGDPPMAIEEVGTFEKDGFRDSLLKIGTHLGTHIDAPAHMLEDGQTLEKYPLDRFRGRGVLIDARQGFDESMVDQFDLREGDIVLVWTDWSKRYHEAAYFKQLKALPQSWADAFVAARISMVGLDQGSPDHPPFSIHKALLSGDVLICENLSNLEQLEKKSFTVWALPLNLAVDGSPARVVAEVD